MSQRKKKEKQDRAALAAFPFNGGFPIPSLSSVLHPPSGVWTPTSGILIRKNLPSPFYENENELHEIRVLGSLKRYIRVERETQGKGTIGREGRKEKMEGSPDEWKSRKKANCYQGTQGCLGEMMGKGSRQNKERPRKKKFECRPSVRGRESRDGFATHS